MLSIINEHMLGLELHSETSVYLRRRHCTELFRVSPTEVLSPHPSEPTVCICLSLILAVLDCLEVNLILLLLP